MRLDLKSLLIGLLTAVVIFLALGAYNSSPGRVNGENSNGVDVNTQGRGRYEIASSGVYPDFFVLDTQTSQTWRYIFDKYAYESGIELIQVEYLGTISKPEYVIIERLRGTEWDGYHYRPNPRGH